MPAPLKRPPGRRFYELNGPGRSRALLEEWFDAPVLLARESRLFPRGQILDLLDFFYLPGRRNGQIGHGSDQASGTLTLAGTRHATEGTTYIGLDLVTFVFNEFDYRLGINSTSPDANLHVRTRAGQSAGSAITATGDFAGEWTLQSGGGEPFKWFIADLTGSFFTTAWQSVATDESPADADFVFINNAANALFPFNSRLSFPTLDATQTVWTIRVRAKLTASYAGSAQFSMRLTLSDSNSYDTSVTNISSLTPGSYSTLTYVINTAAGPSASDTANNLRLTMTIGGVENFAPGFYIQHITVTPQGGTALSNTILERLLGQTSDMLRVIPEGGIGDSTDRLLSLGSTGTLGLGNTVDTAKAVLLSLLGDVSARTGGQNFVELVSGGLTYFSLSGKGTVVLGAAGGDTGDISQFILNLSNNAGTTQDRFTVRDKADAFNPWALNHLGQMVIRNSTGVATTFGRAAAGSGHALTWPASQGAASSFLVNDGAGALSWQTISGPAFLHDLLSATHGDTTAGAVLRGDLITGQTATPKWARLAIGAANTVLRTGGVDPVWGKVVLTTDVTGVLPAANLGQHQHSGSADGGSTITCTIADVASLLTCGDVRVTVSPSVVDILPTTLQISGTYTMIGGIAATTVTHNATTARIIAWPDADGSLAVSGDGTDPPASGKIGQVNRTDRTTSLGPVVLCDASPIGVYVVFGSLEVTAAGSAGSVAVSIAFTDDAGAVTGVPLTTLPATAIERSSISYTLYKATNGTNVSWSTTVSGTPGALFRYALRLRVLFLRGQ